MEHPEDKFDGDIGYLERRGIHASEAIMIGKEVNKIEEEQLDLDSA
jgi:hypothetical protein